MHSGCYSILNDFQASWTLDLRIWNRFQIHLKFLGKRRPNRILLDYLDVSHSRGKWAPTPEGLGFIVRLGFFNCCLDRFFVGCIKHSNVNVP